MILLSVVQGYDRYLSFYLVRGVTKLLRVSIAECGSAGCYPLQHDGDGAQEWHTSRSVRNTVRGENV